MKFAAVFPGQGSQSVGMGEEFFSVSQLSKELFELADKTLGFSLSELCFSGPLEELTLTKYSQPAMLVVSYAAFSMFAQKPEVAAGHSLGEYSALVAAGALEFCDAVSLVHKRGCYMQEAVEPGAGKMLAIMGPEPEEIEDIIAGLSIDGVVEIANLNCPGQTVVAGSAKAIEVFSEQIAAVGAKVIPLNVSAPFHCNLMQPAAQKLALDIDAISICEPNFPVYANVSAVPCTSPQQIRANLKEQVCAQVRWTETIRNIISDQNVSTFVEFGVGTTLSKLIKRTDRQTTQLNVENEASLKKTEDILKN